MATVAARMTAMMTNVPPDHNRKLHTFYEHTQTNAKLQIAVDR